MTFDHSVNDIVLAVTNDGDGSMCGMNYKQRCSVERRGISLPYFRHACAMYSEYRAKHFEQRKATHKEIIEAAARLQAYYHEHVKEMAC